MHFRTFIIAIGVIFLLVPSGWTQDDSGLPTAVITKREMVVTANPLATQAGAKILKIGGTATDAMIAVQTVLGLVEPQSSGLGGGAFIVYYDAKTGRTTTIDAREKAPAAATEDRFSAFIDPFDFFTPWQSGLSVGVPGTPKMMEYMHKRLWQVALAASICASQKIGTKGIQADRAHQFAGGRSAGTKYLL